MASLVPDPSEESTNTGMLGCSRAARPASCMLPSVRWSAMTTAVRVFSAAAMLSSRASR